MPGRLLKNRQSGVCYLFFEDEADGRSALLDVADAGFETTLSAPGTDQDQWRLICERHDYVLDPDVVRENTDYFDDLVERHHGDHDGWEASVG